MTGDGENHPKWTDTKWTVYVADTIVTGETGFCDGQINKHDEYKSCIYLAQYTVVVYWLFVCCHDRKTITKNKQQNKQKPDKK